MKKELNIKAIIFDWGRTLFDSVEKKEFPEAEHILQYCTQQGYRLTVASLVTHHAVATLEERVRQIENSSLRKFFEIALVTDKNKDEIFDQIVAKLNLPREEILIVDDRVVRGIRYGNQNGHPTIWLQSGKFATELPDQDTGTPTFTINSLSKLEQII